jgi:4-amino-4-deoxy-L-arabinose transferase-like glycosyltransferase
LTTLGAVAPWAKLVYSISSRDATACSRAPLLAAFNLTYRLGLESVEEWDESLYATTAWEMLQSGDLIGTTFGGELDYYNSKPPLNVWLIAAMFATFGVNLVSVRIVSATAAWLTVLVLQVWTRRIFGPTVSLLSSLVLATTFGFLHLHAGRSGNPDALLTLLILLIVVALWASQQRPWHLAWLGPLLAGAFLLKGMAVSMPLLVVRRSSRGNHGAAPPTRSV